MEKWLSVDKKKPKHGEVVWTRKEKCGKSKIEISLYDENSKEFDFVTHWQRIKKPVFKLN